MSRCVDRFRHSGAVAVVVVAGTPHRPNLSHIAQAALAAGVTVDDMIALYFDATALDSNGAWPWPWPWPWQWPWQWQWPWIRSFTDAWLVGFD